MDVRSTGQKTEIAMRSVHPLLAVAGVLWLALILVCFFNVELDKASHFSRWDFWVYVPDLVDPPEPGASAGHSGWQYFPQRFDLLAVAAVILGGAWGAGHVTLRIIRPPLAVQSLERTVFALGLGLAVLSLITLGAGLMSWLSRTLLGGIVAAFFVAEVGLRVGGAVLTRGPTGGLTPRRSPGLNPKSARQDGQGRNPKWSLALLAIPALPFLLAMLLGSLLPSTDFDVNEYHFEGPKEFFQAGRVSLLEHNVYTSFPFGTEMLTLLAMVLSGDWYRGALAGKCVLMSFGPLTALALLAAGRRCFGGTGYGTVSGAFAGLFYLATPWVFRISTIAYAEGGVSFYLFTALLAVIVAVDCRRTSSVQAENGLGEGRQFLLAGLLAGSAMACKYPALLSVVVPLGAAVAFHIVRKPRPMGATERDGALPRSRFRLVWTWSSNERGPGWSCAAGFGLGVLIAVGPWLAKNFVETGNPVYPLAYRLFDGRDWNAALDARWRKAHSPSTFTPASVVDLAAEVAYRSTWVSPLLVGLAPWALFAGRWRRRTCWLWAYVAWLFFSCWLFTHRIDRFWVPMLPVLALLAGAGAAWWWSEFPRRWARTALVLPLVAIGLYQLAFIDKGQAGYNDFLLNLDEASNVAADVTAPDLVYLNEHLPQGAKVLSVGDAEMFEARFPVVYNTVFDRSIFEDWFAARPGEAGAIGHLRDPSAIRNKLADEGITHIYVNWLEILRYRAPGSYGYTEFVTPERFAELKSLGILEREWSIPEATMEVERLDPSWREELNTWGTGLKSRRGDKELFITFQVFPVATHHTVASSPLKKGTVPLGNTNLSGNSHSTERDSPLFQRAVRPAGRLAPPLRQGGQGGPGEHVLSLSMQESLTQIARDDRPAGKVVSPRHATPPGPPVLRGGDTATLRLDDGTALFSVAPADSKPFRIRVVDDETGRGVPLVELKTVNDIRYFTDSNGIVAFDEPGLMDESVFFHVQSHGYEFPRDGFGFRGKALQVSPGGEATLQIKRLNVAQRLYRVTGAGIYRDSELCGMELPMRQPVINGKVLGSDSVINAIYHGKIYWFWGDTNRPGYPLGNYHVPGATSELPARNGLDPRVGVDLKYFVDETGFARPTAKMPGEGPTWINGLVVLPPADQDDDEGRERMFAPYVKVKPPLEVYEHGLAEFDDAAHSFKKVKSFENDAPVYPDGHPFVAGAGAKLRHIYFGHPYPLVRVRANHASLSNLAEYEAFTCLKAGSRLSKPEIDRGPDGKVVYSWKPNTPAVGPAEQKRLIASKHLRTEEALLQLADRDSRKAVFAHHGSVYWNEYRGRWMMIAVELAGQSSHLGEIWYSEADSPLGPWAYAVKVVTHNRYSFYNPKQHPMFDQRDGRTIFFEGTYTHTFSGNTDQTPRYDYNQIMYRLDLDDARAFVPVAFYSAPLDSIRFLPRLPPDRTGDLTLNLPDLSKIAFFACEMPASDQPANGFVALCETKTGGPRRLVTKSKPEGEWLGCYVLPADGPKPPAPCVGLYEYSAEDGRRTYSTDPDLSLPGFKRTPQPICRVWKSPWKRNAGG